MTDHSSHSSSPCAAWCNPLQPVSALAEGLDRVVSRGLFQPQPLRDSVIVTSTQRVLLFFMWSKDSLLWKRLPLQGQGPSLFPVGLTPLCPRRHLGGTSLLVLPPGLDLFKCSSVCRACRQSTPSVTPHGLSGHLCVGHAHFVKGRHSPATHHETLFPSTGWKPGVLM